MHGGVVFTCDSQRRKTVHQTTLMPSTSQDCLIESLLFPVSLMSLALVDALTFIQIGAYKNRNLVMSPLLKRGENLHWNYVTVDAGPEPLPVCVGRLLVRVMLVNFRGRHGTQTFELPRCVAHKLCSKCCARILRGDVTQHGVLAVNKLMSHVCRLQNCSMAKTGRSLIDKHVCDSIASRGDTENSHAIPIAAKGGDVSLNPFQRYNLIKGAHVRFC